MAKIIEKKAGSLLWRIIFGIVLVVFALISLARFNANAALFYIIISVYIFIPGRVFKINNKWIKIGIVLVAILLVGFFNLYQQNNAPDTPGQINYIGETNTTIHKDFRTTINADWREFEGSQLSYVFFGYLPPGENASDTNLEFIFVTVGYLGEANNYTLDEILNVSVESSRQTMPDIKLTTNIDKSGNYLDGKEIKFTGTSEGAMREYTQFFGIKYNNIYTVTYSCPIGTCDYYPEYDVFVESFEPIDSHTQ